MKIYRSFLSGAVLGALLASVPVALYLFGYAGPEYERTSTDSSVRGMWPLVSMVFCVAAAGLGAALGALIGAFRVSLARLAILAGYYLLLAAALLASLVLSSAVGRDWRGALGVWSLVGVAPAVFTVLLGALLSRLPQRPAGAR